MNKIYTNWCWWHNRLYLLLWDWLLFVYYKRYIPAACRTHDRPFWF